MTNPITEIKQKEQQAQNLIVRTKEKIDQKLTALVQKYQKNFDNASEEITTEIKKMVQDSQKKIQQIRLAEKKKLNDELKKIKNINPMTINKAADIIIDKIITPT